MNERKPGLVTGRMSKETADGLGFDVQCQEELVIAQKELVTLLKNSWDRLKKESKSTGDIISVHTTLIMNFAGIMCASGISGIADTPQQEDIIIKQLRDSFERDLRDSLEKLKARRSAEKQDMGETPNEG